MDDIVEVPCVDCGRSFVEKVLPEGSSFMCEDCYARNFADDIIQVPCVDCGYYFVSEEVLPEGSGFMCGDCYESNFTDPLHVIRDKSYVPCMDCGDHFVSKTSPGRSYMCGTCQRSNFLEPSRCVGTLYRALRSDEDPITRGLQANDSNANLTVAEHVEHGSYKPSQFISMTGSMAVAAFFAAKGFHERNERNFRIAILDLFNEYGYCDEGWDDNIRAESLVASYGRARNFARKFDEFIFTYREAREQTELKKIVHISPDLLEEFEGGTFNFNEFKVRYDRSELKSALEQTIATERFHVELDIVGLHDYKGSRPTPISEVRLALDNDNENDPNNAIRVQGKSITSEWECVGYLLQEHASVVRKILPHTGNTYRTTDELPDFNHDDTTIKLEFRIPSRVADKLTDEIFNVGGKSYESQRWFISR